MGENALAFRNCLGIDVHHGVRKNAWRDVIKDAWLEDLNAGEHQRRLVSEWLRHRRHACKTSNETIIRLDDAKALAGRVAFQDQCSQSILRAMLGHCCIQIQVRNQFAVNNCEGFAFK